MENLVFVTLLDGGNSINGNKVAVYECKKIKHVSYQNELQTVGFEYYEYGHGESELRRELKENFVWCGEREVTKKEVKEVQRTYPRFTLQKALGKE